MWFIHVAVQQKEKQHCKEIMLLCVSVTQLCSILCDLMDCNPPGSSVHGILQASLLEWVAILYKNKKKIGTLHSDREVVQYKLVQ